MGTLDKEFPAEAKKPSVWNVLNELRASRIVIERRLDRISDMINTLVSHCDDIDEKIGDL